MTLYEWQHLRSSSFLSLSCIQPVGIISLFFQKRPESSANQNSREHPSCKRTDAPLDTHCKHAPFDKHGAVWGLLHGRPTRGLRLAGNKLIRQKT